MLNALDSTSPLVEGATTFVYFSMVAFAVLRWGLTTLAVGAGVADLLLMIPATTDTSAWYFGVVVFLIALPIALAIWAFRVSLRGHVWQGTFAT